MKRFAFIAALGAGLVAAVSTAAAATQLTPFDNFNLDAKYANWGNAATTTLTSGPTSYGIQSQGYGSGYKYLGQNIDARGNDTVQVDVTVNAGVAGFVIDISDKDNNGQQYAWYGLVPGGGIGGGNNYLLTMPIASGSFFGGTGVIDLANVSQLNIGIDPGAAAGIPYNVSFNDLSLTSSATPEPACLSVAALGLILAARRRRG
jgi:hypothetical protein